MDLKDMFLAQLDREAASTRKVIERVPEGRNDWKPHERSMPLGYLAALVASMPGWIDLMIDRDELNLDDPSSEGFRTRAVATSAELVQQFELAVEKARSALRGTSEAHLMQTWRFIFGGHVVSEQPRHEMLSDAVFSHLAHHRGQLTVYLRLNNISVPAIYGPSADEQH
jgi:uncharacterized damage-inducible protein DinB